MTCRRSAIVLGGGDGIGAATAVRLAGDGLAVVVADIDAGRADRVAAQIRAAGGVASAVTADATSAADVGRVVGHTVAEHGRVDAAVLSVYTEVRVPVTAMPDDVWQRTVDVGLTSAFRLAQALVPVMVDGGGGSIVFLSSVQSYFGFPDDPAYSAAKAGVLGLTRQLAVQYGPDRIRVNAVVPSLVLTPTQRAKMARQPAILAKTERSFPLRRVARPHDVAAAIAFLVSDDAAFITGVDLRVDGGISLQPATHWCRITEPDGGWIPAADLDSRVDA